MVTTSKNMLTGLEAVVELLFQSLRESFLCFRRFAWTNLSTARGGASSKCMHCLAIAKKGNYYWLPVATKQFSKSRTRKIILIPVNTTYRIKTLKKVSQQAVSLSVGMKKKERLKDLKYCSSEGSRKLELVLSPHAERPTLLKKRYGQPYHHNKADCLITDIYIYMASNNWYLCYSGFIPAGLPPRWGISCSYYS